MNSCTQAILEHLICHGPKTCHELAAALDGWSYEYIRKRVYQLHNDKRIYVHRWLRRPAGTPGDYIAVYKAGCFPDIKRPSKQPAKQVVRNYWARTREVHSARRRTTDLGIWKGLL